MSPVRLGRLFSSEAIADDLTDRDCALTLGWVGTVLQTATLQLPEDKLSMKEKIDAVGAINKILWIQNDLFARHYIDE